MWNSQHHHYPALDALQGGFLNEYERFCERFFIYVKKTVLDALPGRFFDVFPKISKG